MHLFFVFNAFLITLLAFQRNYAVFCAEICQPIVPFSEGQLVEYIFGNYSTLTRPRKSASLGVEVNISLVVRAIFDFIEKENTLVLDSSLQVSWYDDFLRWNSTYPYSCLKSVKVPADLVWKPDLSLMNSPGDSNSIISVSDGSVHIENNGLIIYIPNGKISSICQVDVTYFPFDKQLCSLEIESWNYDVAKQSINLSEKPFRILENLWTENKQWEIESNSSSLKVMKYPATDKSFSHVTFSLVLRRKALFYYINVIAPSLIISVAELATFVLPTGEVLKIHISFTCLLAYSVFQGMVIADLPRSGDSIPALSLYLDLQMAFIGIIALLGEAVVFLAIQKAEKKKYPPAKWLGKISLFLGKLLRVEQEVGMEFKYQKSMQVPASDQIPPDVVSNENEVRTGGPLSQSARPPTPDEINQEWLYTAEVIDRFNMVAYIAAIVITPLAMFVFLKQPVHKLTS